MAKMFSKAKKAVKHLMRDSTLQMWQERFQTAKSAWGDEIGKMEEREALYLGTRDISKSDGTKAPKQADRTRNIIFELIESQVDSNIPAPKVTAGCEHLEDNAKTIENVIRADIDRLPVERVNDQMERTVPMQGGGYFYVEWDNSIRTHTTVGDLTLSFLHPKQVIPQKGMTDIDGSDYVFIVMTRTKEYIKRRYDIDVCDEDEEDASAATLKDKAVSSDDKVTQIICYYRNNNGGIGLYSWVNDTVLDDMEDYQARKGMVCTKCGAPKPIDSDVCLECGGEDWKEGKTDYEELAQDIALTNGNIIPAYETDATAMPVEMEADGMAMPVAPGTKRTRIPFFRPNKFPLVLRKNVSAYGQILGDNDVDKIKDQQMTINKLGTKINEKLLKGGSVLTLPKGVNLRRDDSEFKILDIKSPMDFQSIQVLTLQPNITYDSAERDKAYYEAQSTLGITNSFQGKADTTATSGKAKQIQIQQAAGRLESKRVMKNAAYADLYELMFLFRLAYTDEPRTFRGTDQTGQPTYCSFSRYDFIEKDAAGEWFYNTDFMFSTDVSGTLAGDREAMWQEARLNLQSGALGNPQETETLIRFWAIMDKLHYPSAKEIKTQMQEKQEIEQMQQQQMAQLQQQRADQMSQMAQQEQQQIQGNQQMSLDSIIQQMGGQQ